MNSDGMGIAYAHEGKLIIYKTMKSIGKLLKKYHHARELKAPCILHFRVATQGEVCERNCHPYNLSNDLVFAHNGTITVPGAPRNKTLGTPSDSAVFGKLILKPLNKSFPKWRDAPTIRGAISKYIGTSKLVFLDTQGRIDIIGEDRGYWDNNYGGAWFSNLSYMPYSSLLTYWRDLIPTPEGPKEEIKALPHRASRMTLSPPDSQKQSGVSAITHGEKPRGTAALYNMAGIVIPKVDPLKQSCIITNGYQWEGRTYCIGCLPTHAMASSSLLTLYDELGAVHVCSVCGRGLEPNDYH